MTRRTSGESSIRKRVDGSFYGPSTLLPTGWQLCILTTLQLTLVARHSNFAGCVVPPSGGWLPLSA
jgi:hypothetical protein